MAATALASAARGFRQGVSLNCLRCLSVHSLLPAKSLAFSSVLSSSSLQRSFSTLPYIDGGGNYYPRLRCAYRIDMISPDYEAKSEEGPFPDDVPTAARLTASLHQLPLTASEKSILLEMIFAHNPLWYVKEHALIIIISKALPTHNDNRNRCLQQLEALIVESRRLAALIMQRRSAGVADQISVQEAFGASSEEGSTDDELKALENWRKAYERKVDKPEWVDFHDYKAPLEKVKVLNLETKVRSPKANHRPI